MPSQNTTNLLWNLNRPICLSWCRNLCRHLPEYYNPPDRWLSRNFYGCGLFLYLKIILRSMMKCCFWEHSNQNFYLSRFFLFLFFLYHDCFSWRFAWIFWPLIRHILMLFFKIRRVFFDYEVVFGDDAVWEREFKRSIIHFLKIVSMKKMKIKKI